MPESSMFDTLAAVYAAGRPTYPDGVFDAIQELSGRALAGSRVADVGAGTGISTRQLRDRGAEVTAVELSGPMVRRLVADSPGVTAVMGSANALPLRDASVDFVTFAQAWHWVETDRAVPEVLRVLKPGGALACFWNHAVPERAVGRRLRRAGQGVPGPRLPLRLRPQHEHRPAPAPDHRPRRADRPADPGVRDRLAADHDGRGPGHRHLLAVVRDHGPPRAAGGVPGRRAGDPVRGVPRRTRRGGVHDLAGGRASLGPGRSPTPSATGGTPPSRPTGTAYTRTGPTLEAAGRQSRRTPPDRRDQRCCVGRCWQRRAVTGRGTSWRRRRGRVRS